MSKRMNEKAIKKTLKEFLLAGKKIQDGIDKILNESRTPQPLQATQPCPQYGKKKGHMSKEDKGIFYQCECGFCWWKSDNELCEELRVNK